MPFAPDYSDYLRLKKLQKQINTDEAISVVKTRAPSAYGSYRPTYRIQYLPPNLFLPGRLYTSSGGGGGAPITIDFNGLDFSKVRSVDLFKSGITAPLTFPSQSVITYNLRNALPANVNTFTIIFYALEGTPTVTEIRVDGVVYTNPSVQVKNSYASYTFSDVSMNPSTSTMIVTTASTISSFVSITFNSSLPIPSPMITIDFGGWDGGATYSLRDAGNLGPLTFPQSSSSVLYTLSNATIPPIATNYIVTLKVSTLLLTSPSLIIDNSGIPIEVSSITVDNGITAYNFGGHDIDINASTLLFTLGQSSNGIYDLIFEQN